MSIKDTTKPRGKVELYATKGSPKLKTGRLLSARGGLKVYESAEIDFEGTDLIDTMVVENIIVNKGKDAIITALYGGSMNMIGRMAIGDRGTLPSDPTVPKVPVSTFESLYHEIYRGDCDAVVPNVGTDTTHEVKFIKTFSALDIPISAFSNQTNPVVNEIGLITFDDGEGPLPRPPIYSPNPTAADEMLFSIRTFKSVPFEAANEISITIRYTIFIE